MVTAIILVQARRDKVKDAANKTRDYLHRQKESLASAVDRGREAYHAARDNPEQA